MPQIIAALIGAGAVGLGWLVTFLLLVQGDKVLAGILGTGVCFFRCHWELVLLSMKGNTSKGQLAGRVFWFR